MGRTLALLAAAVAVASCTVSRDGPSKREIFEGSVMRSGDAHIIMVNKRVSEAANQPQGLGFSHALRSGALMGGDTIRPGDVIRLNVYENVPEGLLAPSGANNAIVEEVQVDDAGFIFVPYAGRIKAAGNTPEVLRRVITEQLKDQTPDPQVQVRRLAGDGATVSLMGAVGAQGVYPIERPTRTLSSMLAQAGGVSIEPEIAQVTVIRGQQTGKVWFQDLYRNPRFDIALRGGDRILIEGDTRSFTALGATGSQSRVPFETQTLSGVEALAQVGGLSASTADPTGVFILRNEPADIANAVLGRNDLQGEQRMVYVLDLTQPNALFMARDFSVRDGDTLYVTEAPFTQWSRAIAALTGSLTAVDTLTTTPGSL
jgi:polysaccharide export outer membrane protein